jgi:hypothetical protein
VPNENQWGFQKNRSVVVESTTEGDNMSGYFPSKDALFDGFGMNIKTYVESKTLGAHPDWEHIPADAVTALSEAIIAFHSAYGKMAGAHTPTDTEWKNKKRKEAEKVISAFVNQYLRFPPVTDEDRINMGIPNKDTIHTNHPAPTSQPDVDVLPTTNHYEHKVRAMNHATGKPVKPADAYGVRFAWQIGGERPANGEDLPKSKFTRKASLVVTYVEADKKKTAYYGACYENAKGDQGAWSPIVEADIA